MYPYTYQPQFQPQYQPQYQPQLQQPLYQRSGISGRTVNSPDEITVQEVPTDGSVALFPTADGSTVYAKKWTPDGNITTIKYSAEGQVQQPTQNDVIMGKLDQILKAVGGDD